MGLVQPVNHHAKLLPVCLQINTSRAAGLMQRCKNSSSEPSLHPPSPSLNRSIHQQGIWIIYHTITHGRNPVTSTASPRSSVVADYQNVCLFLLGCRGQSHDIKPVSAVLCAAAAAAAAAVVVAVTVVFRGQMNDTYITAAPAADGHTTP